MPTFRTTVMGAVAAAFLAVAPMAQADETAVRETIESQMAAFAADDGAAAFGYASPSLQAYFRTPDRFMQMVQSAYMPVYRPSNVRFERYVERDGQMFQEVRLTGPKGGDWLALYTLETQDDGSLRITGCQLVKQETQGV